MPALRAVAGSMAVRRSRRSSTPLRRKYVQPLLATRRRARQRVRPAFDQAPGREVARHCQLVQRLAGASVSRRSSDRMPAASSVVSDVPPTRSMNGRTRVDCLVGKAGRNSSQPEPKSLLACTIVMLRSAESMKSSLTALVEHRVRIGLLDDREGRGRPPRDCSRVSQKAVWIGGEVVGVEGKRECPSRIEPILLPGAAEDTTPMSSDRSPAVASAVVLAGRCCLPDSESSPASRCRRRAGRH